MASFPTPTQIEEAYFRYLKSIKPALNVNDANSDFVIRGRVFAGIISGLYGDQAKIYNDTFISTARPEALLLRGQDLGLFKQPATRSQSSQVRLSGPNGVEVLPGELTFLYQPTNLIYTNTTGGIITDGFLSVQVRCETTGQAGNIQAPDTLTLVSPPNRISAEAVLVEDLADGADLETDDSFRARLLAREQQPPRGGNVEDYPQFAFDADPSVRSAFIRRFGRGLGTVDIYITTGTTDVDQAVTNGLDIVRIPSSIVIDRVQQYYDSHVPLTDCPAVFAPEEGVVDVSVTVSLAEGLTLASIPSDPQRNPLNLNIEQLIRREISRVLYHLPVGGREIPGQTGGFVVASDIEAGLDAWLSALKDPNTGLPLGKIPVLSDRQVHELASDGYNQPIGENELAEPGTLTINLR